MEILDYKSFKILIVDDEKENLEAFKMEFGEYFDISVASSGKEALKFLEGSGEVAVVIVDQRMPEMRGVTLLREIVKHYPDTIRFLITAYSDTDAIVEAINTGQVYKYVSKPWEHEDVKVSLMRAIESYYLTKEKERLTEEKIATVKKAAEAHRLGSLGMLAAGIAHEINNPLVSISTFFKLIPQKIKDLCIKNKEDLDPSFWGDFFQVAEGELKRVQDLVKELLNLAKPPKYDFEETNLMELLQAEAGIFESAAKAKGVEFVMDMDEKKVPLIHCDQSRIKQLLLNLVLNAVQATKKGGKVTVQFRGTKGRGMNRQLEIAVIDTGQGISEEELDKIFQPFFTTKQWGTGLGLVICDFIVKHHGGDISVESRVGKGTTFIISLPVQTQTPKPQEVLL